MPKETTTTVKVNIGIPFLNVVIEVPFSKASKILGWFRRLKDGTHIIDRLHQDVGREEKVTLKICCYTLQTTLTMLLPFFEKLARSNHLPDVELMILRPDLTKPLRIWNKKNPNDRRYWKAVREDVVTSEAIRKIIRENYPRVKFKERVFPFDPCVKTIIANDCVAFFGLYVVKRHRKTDRPHLIALDYLGTRTELIELPAGDVLKELTIWFDRTWKTLK